jgi:hypothetical protein
MYNLVFYRIEKNTKMKTQNTSPLLVAQDNNKEVVSNQEVVSKVIVQTLKEEKCKSVMKNSISNSISPSIEEIERFIIFLNNKFKLGLQDNLIINIQDTSINTKGFFMPKEHKNHYDNTTNALNYICISSLYLKEKPYITIAHELAHFINELENHKSKGNYHTKHFKKTAEKLLLIVNKGQYGFNQTDESPAFIEMLQEFKPSDTAFLIYQNKENNKKVGSRNLLFTCNCGVKVRTAKNENKPLNAMCLYCNSEFKQSGEEFAQ